MKPPSRFSSATRTKAFALVLVLAFVVLLTGVCLAFFSNSLLQRQVSTSSASRAKLDLLAQGAIDNTVGDLKREIVAGSTVQTVASENNVYPPRVDQTNGSTPTVVPARTATADTIPNLIKRSASGQPFYPTANYDSNASNRAAPVSSLTPSRNGRFVDPTQWNRHLFFPTASSASNAPVGSSGSGSSASWSLAPDWILVAKDGGNPIAPDANVVGRYAYAIIDQGGSLDVNVAGYPPSLNANATQRARFANRANLAFVDLTQLTDPPGSRLLTDAEITAIVGWRNQASGQFTGSFPTYSVNTADDYFKEMASNRTGFLKNSARSLSGAYSDRMFVGRQQFLDFLESLSPSGELTPELRRALPYLTTFTRGLSQPSYAFEASSPVVLAANRGGNNALGLDGDINPGKNTAGTAPFPAGFLSVRATGEFPRNDGTTAVSGEPLVKKRFALERLAWLTWEGPSSGASAATREALKEQGVSDDILNAGTDENIRRYFGLTWNAGTQVWRYDVHNGGAGPIRTMRGIADLGAAAHDPDFFELLKAAINVGSVGRAITVSNSDVTMSSNPGPQALIPENYNYATDSSVDCQILKIGANIIDQFDLDSYPTRIQFNDGVLEEREFQGVENLPYLYDICTGALLVRNAQPEPSGTADPSGNLQRSGIGALVQTPALWNPHDFNSPMGNPRPQYFRVVMDSAPPAFVDSSSNAGYIPIFTFATGPGVDPAGPENNSYDSGGDPENPSWNFGSPSPLRYMRADNSAIAFDIPSAEPASNQVRTLFREPTFLMRAGFPANTNARIYDIESSRIKTESPVSMYSGARGLTNFFPLGIDIAPTGWGRMLPVDTQYISFYLGAFPLRWRSPSNQVFSANNARCATGITYPGTGAACFFTYRVQYSLNQNGPWITYDTKYARTLDSNPTQATSRVGLDLIGTQHGERKPALFMGSGNDYRSGYWATALDPRTSRFGILPHYGTTATGSSGGLGASEPNLASFDGRPNNARSWLDNINGVIYTSRSDMYTGTLFETYVPSIRNRSGGWVGMMVNNLFWLNGGMFAQNNVNSISGNKVVYGASQGDEPYGPMYYSDPDGVVRRGVGAYVPRSASNPPPMNALPPAQTTVGLPTAQSLNWTTNRPPSPNPWSATRLAVGDSLANHETFQAQSRPFIVNRPFRNVGELGYVFRDTPWKNLDFFTVESGDSALLDVFCVNDTSDPEGLVAGKVDLNTRNQPVIRAILAGSAPDAAHNLAATNTETAFLSATAADRVAQALVRRTTTAGSARPIQNVADLVGRWTTRQAINATFTDGKRSYRGFASTTWGNTDALEITNPATDIVSAYAEAFPTNANFNGLRETFINVKRINETAIRALSEAGQSRVWNIMLDVVAQTGRYPTGADLAGFEVDGERRYWVHLAIDRLTGKVLDKHVEMVNQ